MSQPKTTTVTDNAKCRWLSGVKQVAGYLDVDPRTVQRWRHKYPAFPAQVVEGTVRANTCALDAWVLATARLKCPTCGREI